MLQGGRALKGPEWAWLLQRSRPQEGGGGGRILAWCTEKGNAPQSGST